MLLKPSQFLNDFFSFIVFNLKLGQQTKQTKQNNSKILASSWSLYTHILDKIQHIYTHTNRLVLFCVISMNISKDDIYQ